MSWEPSLTGPPGTAMWRDDKQEELDPRGCRYVVTENPSGIVEGADNLERVSELIDSAFQDGEVESVTVALGSHVLEDRRDAEQTHVENVEEN